MRKDGCDRSIVETNEKMGKVIQWYQDNQEWLDKEEFQAPMESGCIVLKEEELERIYTLRELGYWPYVMVYNKNQLPKGHKALKVQRWVNMRAVFETTPYFEDYKA